MFRYIIKRILIFIPTILIITIIGFVISVNAPGDPVERLMTAAGSGGELGTQSVSQTEQKKYWKKKLGLDLPVFYFSLDKYAYPDTLYKIYDKNEKEALSRLIDQYGNWPQIAEYYLHLNVLYNKLLTLKPDSTILQRYDGDLVIENLNTVKFEVLSLRAAWQENIIVSKMQNIRNLLGKDAFWKDSRNELDLAETAYARMKSTASAWKNYIPVIHFYPANQYHRWLFGDGGVYSRGILRGDFGTSYQTKDAVSKTIFDRIGWSLFFMLISVVIAYMVSIPIGVKAAQQRGKRFDRVSSALLFGLYSLPNFFVAILLLMLFANPDVFDILPASGVKPDEGYPDDAGIFEKIRLTFPHLIIPMICYSYSSFAFLSRIMRGSMIENFQMDYIRTAYAKGLSPRIVAWKHAFRNSLLPVITIFAAVFPAAVGGSVILETIFSIPGMGLETFNAIAGQNYPMIIAVLTLTSLLTLLGYLVSDVLYALVDPRISYS
jgi:peptide/nickel transport system permease protein